MFKTTYHIDKIYYWDADMKEVAVTFDVVSSRGDTLDRFDSYTKAERKIVELLEKANL